MQSIIRFVKVLYNILMQQKKRNVYQITFQIELTDESVISTYQDDIRFFPYFRKYLSMDDKRAFGFSFK